MSIETDSFGPRRVDEDGSYAHRGGSEKFVWPAPDRRPPPKWRADVWFSNVVLDAELISACGTTAGWVDTTTLRILRGDNRRPLVAGDLVRDDGRRRTVVAKAYRDDRGAATLRMLHVLSGTGLGAGSFMVTAGLGWSSVWRALVTEEAPGVAWSELLYNPAHELTQASAAVAAWLRMLQSLPLGVDAGPLLPDRSAYRAATEMVAQVERLGRQYPRARRRLALLSQHALLSLTAVVDQELVPSHGDLHPHNVHVRRQGNDILVTVLDLDTVGLRRPSYDVGYAVAQLLIMSMMRCRSFVPGALAAQAFLTAMCDENSPLCAHMEAVDAEVTRALLQSLYYELVTLANGRVDLLPRWCGVAEAMLSDGVAEVLPRLAGGWRP